MSGRIFPVLLLAAWLLVPTAQAQSSAACNAELQHPRPVAAHTLAALAQHEHARMGGALIAANGSLVRAGITEAERSPLPGSGQPAWQHVWRYWHAVPDFYAQHMAWLGAMAPEALRRTTLIDQPWSAAFISWLMREAGLTQTQFAFSASHHDYVRASLAATEAEHHGSGTAYGWRACDPAHTPPRLGDLLCFARGTSASLDTFAQIRAAVLRGPVSMHCELVVLHDTGQIQAMGGNVLDTVVLRTLDLARNGSGLLWPAYRQANHRQQQQPWIAQLPPGEPQSLWPQTHLSQQPWSLLLQMRAVAWQ